LSITYTIHLFLLKGEYTHAGIALFPSAES